MCHVILTENLSMHHVAATFVLRLLSEDQNRIVFMSVKSLSTVQMLMITFKRRSSQALKLGSAATVSKQMPSLRHGS
jgi:hypothetical protein